MVDELFDRSYQHGRASMNGNIHSGVSRLARAFGDSFRVLHRIEWSAPWEAKAKRAQFR